MTYDLINLPRQGQDESSRQISGLKVISFDSNIMRSHTHTHTHTHTADRLQYLDDDNYA